jgi:hypothetical protein
MFSGRMKRFSGGHVRTIKLSYVTVEQNYHGSDDEVNIPLNSIPIGIERVDVENGFYYKLICYEEVKEDE